MALVAPLPNQVRCTNTHLPRQAGPSTDGDAACAAWVRSTASALSPHVAGCYVNEVMMDSPGQLGRCYDAATRVRLEALKARVDPQGLLRALDWEG